MADHLEALQNVVQDTIDQERLGQPQFIRCIARATDNKSLESTLNQLTFMGESWFGGPPIKRTRQGNIESDVYVTEIQTWDTGQSALITVSTTISKGDSTVDLMLIGSRGTLYHQG
jgi:hypothetical protein